MEQNTIGMAKFRATFADVMRDVEEKQEAVVIRKHGKPLAAVVPASWLERLNDCQEEQG